MVVKIVKTSNPAFWYAPLVGQVFNVEDNSFIDDDKAHKYTVVPPKGSDPFLLINVEDTKVVLK